MIFVVLVFAFFLFVLSAMCSCRWHVQEVCHVLGSSDGQM